MRKRNNGSGTRITCITDDNAQQNVEVVGDRVGSGVTGVR